jgi:hypothetical protein
VAARKDIGPSAPPNAPLVAAAVPLERGELHGAGGRLVQEIEVSSQKTIHEAFLWVRQVYEEARVMLDDTRRIAAELGFAAWKDVVLTGYATVLRANDLPFVYLATLFFSPEAVLEEEAGTAIFLTIDFHSDLRKGPYLLVGTVRHSSCSWNEKDLINETVRRLGWQGYFETKKPGTGEVVYVHTPIGNYKTYAGVEEVRHVEIPLTFVDTPERLRCALEGVIALRDGDASKLAALVAQSAATIETSA